DDQNQKIIRSRDVIFNEEVMYKGKLGTGTNSTCYEVRKTGVILLNEIHPQTPVGEFTRSSRTIRLHERYSPALYYILLTDKGELETYEDAV
ncbi:hypothetical protein TorRG33x02_294860, partial [Trema orientale]